MPLIIDRIALAKQGDNALGSIRLSVTTITPERSRSNFWCAAVDINGSALPRATKSNNYHHYQSKVIVCVSVISGRMRIIARMGSLSFEFL